MSERMSYRDTVRDIALDHYGFVTTRMAAEAGVPAAELPKLASRGGLESVAYGVYRVLGVPATQYDQYAEALLRVGEGAYLRGESVLAFLELADVNPRQVKVAVNRRARPALPAFVDLAQVKGEARIVTYEGLASQSVGDALLDCRGRIETARLFEAAKKARSEGLLNASEWQQMKKELKP